MFCPSRRPRADARPGRADSEVPFFGLLAALLLLLLLGGGGILFWHNYRLQQERMEALALEARDEAERAREQDEQDRAVAGARKGAERARNLAEEGLRKTRERQAEQSAERARRLCEEGKVGEGLLWFVRGLGEAGDNADLQRAFRLNLAAWGLPGPGPREAARHKGPVRSLAFTPDGKAVVPGDEAVAGGAGDALAVGPAGPAGKLRAVAAGKAARLQDVVTHQAVGRPLAHDADVLSAAFSPDGREVATGDTAGVVRVWRLPAPVEGDGARLKLWAEVTAGAELDAAGAVRPLDPAARALRRRKLDKLGGPPGS